MMKLLTILGFALYWVAAYALDTTYGEDKLPVVDLGYGRYQATLNVTGNYFNFSNIRYAEPPIGELRFAAPVAPRGRNSNIDNGSVARICPQAYPTGVWANQIFNSYYSRTGNTSLDGFQNATQGFDYPRATPSDPRATEDCLFLDLMVPQKVFDGRSSRPHKLQRGAAVMVWIHGGGFGAGTKYDTPPAGLVLRSQEGGKDGVIYVTINYRLGAMGWSSGPSFAVDGLANAGLHDQRLALKWVQDNIHLFGGDRKRVTVFGESAGGGSIAHHLTAYGGRGSKPLFKRAILQSPGYNPSAGNLEQETNFRTFLSLLNVTTLEEARKLPTQAIQTANEYQVRTSKIGSWTYGPVIDGHLVPDTPSLSLLHNNFHSSVEVMVGHNGDEGMGYPSLATEKAFESYLGVTFPNAPETVRNYISDVLYPPTLPTSGDVPEDYKPNITRSMNVNGYNTGHGRQALLTSETVITCLTYYVNKAFKGKAHSYIFTVPPALHGQELYYVFYNGQASDVFYQPMNVTVAHMMQDYWLSFARSGNPNGKGLPYFSKWGNNSTLQSISLAGVGPTRDPTDNDRCRWWQRALYL